MKRKATGQSGRSKKRVYTGQAAGAAYRREVARRAIPSRSLRVGEVKGMDTELTAAGPVVNTTGTNANAVVLNLVRAGTGSWNRVGRKIYPKSLRLKGAFLCAYAAQTTTLNLQDMYIRMVVVWDKQPSGAAIPAWDTVFGVTNQAGGEVSTLLAPPRYDNMDRFRVLKDCMFNSDVQATPATGGSTNQVLVRLPFDEYIKMKGVETVFSGQSEPMTIADISTGALYVFFRASNATANTASVSIEEAYARLRSTD